MAKKARKANPLRRVLRKRFKGFVHYGQARAAMFRGGLDSIAKMERHGWATPLETMLGRAVLQREFRRRRDG